MKKVKRNSLPLICALIVLMIISLFNMKNAVLLSSTFKFHFQKQLLWYFLGFLILLLFQKVNIQKILKYSFWYYILSLILLALVLLFGKSVNGARAWFDFGPVSFQPSELMKIALALYLAEIIHSTKLNGFKSELLLILKVMLITLIPSILVFVEPDTGAILFYLLISFSMLFISGIKKWWFIVFFLFLFLLLGTFVLLYIYNPDFLIQILGTSFFYRVERIITFHTESSYQLENALTVIGSASLWGTGLGKVSLYIPEAATDFIFAFTIGNFGIITGFVVLLSYLFIDFYLIQAYYHVQNKKIKLFLISFISIFFFQQLINIGMNLGLMPIIGIPLPFLSYGGSTMMIYFIFLAFVLKLKSIDHPSILN